MIGMLEARDSQDAEWHCDSQQSPSDIPLCPAEGSVQLQAGTHQRNDHDQLGEALGHLGIGERQWS